MREFATVHERRGWGRSGDEREGAVSEKGRRRRRRWWEKGGVHVFGTRGPTGEYNADLVNILSSLNSTRPSNLSLAYESRSGNGMEGVKSR